MAFQRLPVEILEIDAPSLYYHDRLDIERQRELEKKRYAQIPEAISLKDYGTMKEKDVFKYDYRNSNNVGVTIMGSFEDVVSVKAVLEKYNPPKLDVENAKKILNESYTVKFFNKTSSVSFDQNQIGVSYDKNHAIIEKDGLLFSGSGSLIIFDYERPLVALFRSVETKQYDDLGGKIDRNINFKQDINDVLFENAKKETNEESAELILLENKSKYVDINSDKSNSIYRSYIYKVKTETSTTELKIEFQKKLQNIYSNLDKTPDYKETDDLEFFDLQYLKDYVKDFDPNISHGVVQTITGRLVRIRGRVLRVIKSMIRNNVEPETKQVKLESNQLKI